MEDFDQELFREMVINEIAGLLSEEEQACLDTIIAVNPEAYEIRNQLNEAVGSAQIMASSELHKYDPMDVFRAFENGLPGKPPSPAGKAAFIKPIGITVAVMVLTMVALYTYTINDLRIHSQAAVSDTLAITEDHRLIGMVLPDSQRLDLSVDTANILVDNVVFINRGNRLRFRGKGLQGLAVLTVAASAGRDYSVVLSDKTVIKLSPGSALSFPINFTERTRSIFIKGKAFLQVAPNDNLPFIVELPNHHKLQVLGTSFNVDTHDQDTIKVSLLSGSIKMETPTDSLYLKSGYQAISVNGGSLEADKMDLAELVYEFREQPLHQVAKIISQWYNIEVAPANDKVSNMLLTGKIDRRKPLQTFLNQLKTINFQYQLNATSDTLRFW